MWRPLLNAITPGGGGVRSAPIVFNHEKKHLVQTAISRELSLKVMVINHNLVLFPRIRALKVAQDG